MLFKGYAKSIRASLPGPRPEFAAGHSLGRRLNSLFHHLSPLSGNSLAFIQKSRYVYTCFDLSLNFQVLGPTVG
jgi:hypothetical protein